MAHRPPGRPLGDIDAVDAQLEHNLIVGDSHPVELLLVDTLSTQAKLDDLTRVAPHGELGIVLADGGMKHVAGLPTKIRRLGGSCHDRGDQAAAGKDRNHGMNTRRSVWGDGRQVGISVPLVEEPPPDLGQIWPRPLEGRPGGHTQKSRQ